MNSRAPDLRYILAIAVFAAMVVLLILFVLRSFSVMDRAEAGEASAFTPRDVLTVYRTDPASMELRPALHISVPENAPMDERLSLLARELSRTVFDGFPIEVRRIESRDGKKIAVVDLREREDFRRTDSRATGWPTRFFQGSTGGQATEEALVTTFLQKQYPGPWVDGVVFLHEGERMEALDHIDLSPVFMRDAYGTGPGNEQEVGG